MNIGRCLAYLFLDRNSCNSNLVLKYILCAKVKPNNSLNETKTHLIDFALFPFVVLKLQILE